MMEIEKEKEIEKKEEGEEDQKVFTDWPWRFLFVLVCATIIICAVRTAWGDYHAEEYHSDNDHNNNSHVDNRNYTECSTKWIHQFYKFYESMYYGKNIVSESEFLSGWEVCSDGDKKWVEKISFSIVSIFPVLFVFSFWLVFALPHCYNKCLIYFHLEKYTLGEHPLNAAWLGRPLCYSTIYGYIMIHIMFWWFDPYKPLGGVQLEFEKFSTSKAGLIVTLCICYLFLVFYYLMKMTIARQTAYVIIGEERFLTNLIVCIGHTVTYNFGTACFNATVILPPLLALKTIIEKSRDTQDDEEDVERGNWFERFFRNAYMTIFIADYSTIMTGMEEKDAAEATETMLDLIDSGFPVRKLRQVENIYMSLTINASIGYFAILMLWYVYNGQGINFLLVALESSYNIFTVMLPLVYVVFGTVLTTRSICSWGNDEDWVVVEEELGEMK